MLKLNMESCLICKRTGQKLFNINLYCGDGQNTIKGDIIEFVGDSIADHLDDSHHVCNICINMLDDIVKSKFKVLEAITNNREQKFVPNLGLLWTSYQNKFANDTYNDSITPSLTPNTPPLQQSRDSTPLYFVSKTKKFNEVAEKFFEMKESIRSNTNMRNTSNRKKSKKPGRPKSAEIKRIRQELVKSVQSDRMDRKRPVSVASEMSIISVTEEEEGTRKRGRRARRKSVLVYSGNGELIYPLKKTRSVSRCQEENESEKLYRCSMPDCNMGEMTLYTYTCHMEVAHKARALYRCFACDIAFLNKEHLKVHQQMHDIYPIICGVCGVMQKNETTYHQHIEQHQKTSFTCCYCDLSFTTKVNLNRHVFDKHKQKKIYQRPQYGIVKQVVYKADCPSKEPDIENFTEYFTKNTQSPAFRSLSFVELENLQRKRLQNPPGDATRDDTKMKSLGDDYSPVASLAEDSVHRRTPVTSHSFLYSPPRRKKKPVAGRCTPLGSTSDDEDEDYEEEELRPFYSSNWIHDSRDLESRNTEVANICARSDFETDGDSGDEDDEEVAHLNSIMDKRSSPEAEIDVDTETQYIDGDNILPEISNSDFDISNS